MPRVKRYAAGRARALGLPTRGTTAPNRLRRVDRWLVGVHGDLLRRAASPLVVDLGYGASPVTAVELHARLRAVRPDVEVVGIEIDQERVDAAQAVGGFELAGLRPAVVRALNVLRQYEREPAAQAWRTMSERLAPGGLLVEGTCDELGRRAAWVALDGSGPRTLTLAAHLPTLPRPSELAERLPKALIHDNVPGSPVHELLRALDDAWDRAAPQAVFGPRARWTAACEGLRWPGADVRRSRLGELTVPWSTVAPT
ncbi:MAG TPA: class I SAM-dependent methyltransferase [Mycobacteriales bacterium]|nr:class I SAM-dependent methyltransferase [Mycobacteriales bacterium]